MLTWFLDLLFPPLCLNCRQSVKSGEAVCDLCFSNIKIFKTFFCGKCRLRLAESKKICHQDFPYLLGAAADYQNETVKYLVQNLKFGFVRSAARPLASLLVMCAEIIGYPLTGFVVAPIPLSKMRGRQRGFNQSFLIAKIFAEHFNLELNPDMLAREKNTRPQSEIEDFEKKRENVKNCFSVKEPNSIQGKNIILIDDVVTSGATLFEAANALKRAGAKKIIAFAAAKS